MIKGWKKLTKKQRKHLNEHNANDTFRFTEMRKEQVKQNKMRSDVGLCSACFTCDEIAKVLEMG